jgi:hypothetical protein
MNISPPSSGLKLAEQETSLQQMAREKKMDKISSKTSAHTRNIGHSIPVDKCIHIYRCENLVSCKENNISSKSLL